jgi:antitoxin (DNA-binding transcriptional repressor) of toxin-antitoxin stability system
VFARVERGEAIEVTRHGKTIAVVVPGSGVLGRYVPLIARGVIRIKPTTTRALDQLPNYAVPDDVSPLDVLLAEREADDR